MKKMIKKIIFALIICITVIAGCSSGTNNRKDELVFWNVGTEEESRMLNQIGEIFYKETGIRIRCESISWGDAHTKYLTSIVGEVTPDIGTMALTWGTEFGLKNAMVNLSNTFGDDVKRLKSRVFPSIWSATEYKNNIFAVPYDMTVHTMYYRNDIVDTPPVTWDELTSLLIELKKKNKSMIFGWGSMQWLGYAPFLWQDGGGFYDAEGTRSTLDTSSAAESLVFFTELYTKYHVPKSEQNITMGLKTGRYPIGIGGSWLINTIPLEAPELNGKWSIALLPAGKTGKHTAFIGGRVMGIFKDSKNIKNSWKFINFLYRPDIQKKLYNIAKQNEEIYLPPIIDVWDGLSMNEDMRGVLKAQLIDARAPPSVAGWNDSTRFIIEAIEKVIIKGTDSKEALNIAAREMNSRIKQY